MVAYKPNSHQTTTTIIMMNNEFCIISKDANDSATNYFYVGVDGSPQWTNYYAGAEFMEKKKCLLIINSILKPGDPAGAYGIMAPVEWI